MMDYLQPYTFENFPFNKIMCDTNAMGVHEILSWWVNSSKKLQINLRMTHNLDNYGLDRRVYKKEVIYAVGN